MKSNIKGSVFLLSAALVWGLAFIAQKGAAGAIGVFSYTCLRSIVTCVVLFPVCLRRAKRFPSQKSFKAHLLPGLVMGALTFGAIGFQQWGLEYTAASKSGFVTALYIIIVPLLGLFFRQKPRFSVWIAVVLGLTGTAFLSLDFSEGFSVGKGELLTLGCAVVFSVHILFADRLADGYDSVLICAVQFAVCCVIGFFGMILFEKVEISQIKQCLVSILYVGGISGAVGYTFQLIGQKYAEPALASLLMCMESVFGALGGWLIGGELLTALEYTGCALLLLGCIIAQLPAKKSIGRTE